MQEFSSISVSSYEAGTLADRLTEQAAEGWAVVAIVPTGSTVTAYLSRASGAETTAAAPGTEAVDTADDDRGDHTEPAGVPVLPDASEDDADADQGDHPAVDEADDGDAEADAGDHAAGDDISAAPSPEPAHAAEPTPEPAATGHAVAPEPTPEPAATGHAEAPGSEPVAAATPAAGAAPAGWYADPSARFELRYWDGSQWTEHVSRAGQQYTDPPVA